MASKLPGPLAPGAVCAMEPVRGISRPRKGATSAGIMEMMVVIADLTGLAVSATEADLYLHWVRTCWPRPRTKRMAVARQTDAAAILNRLRAVGYCRVSTKRQADHQISLEEQHKKIDATCVLRDADLVETFVEPGLTARADRRPELKRMLEFACNPANGIDLAKREALLRRVDLQYVVNGVVRSPDPKVIASIEASIADAERARDLSRAEAEQYSGGLVQSLAIVKVATDELTLSQLRLALLSERYGFGVRPADASAASQPVGQTLVEEDADAL